MFYLFTMQKSFSFVYDLINLLVFLLWLLDLNMVTKTFPTPRSQMNSYIFFNYTYDLVLHLPILEFILMYDMRYGFNFIFFQMVTQMSQHHLIKKKSSFVFNLRCNLDVLIYSISLSACPCASTTA